MKSTGQSRPKTTSNLMRELMQTERLDRYLEKNSGQMVETSLAEELTRLLEEQQLTRSEIAVRSGLSRVYIYEVFAGKKIPSRDSVIRICFALSLGPQEIVSLLKHTGYPSLYPRSRRDAVILFAARRHTTLAELNEMLSRQHLPEIAR